MMRSQQHQSNHRAQLSRLDLLLEEVYSIPRERVGYEFSICIRDIVQIHDTDGKGGKMQERSVIWRLDVCSNRPAHFSRGDTHIVSEALFIYPPAPRVEESEKSLECFFVHCLVKAVW